MSDGLVDACGINQYMVLQNVVGRADNVLQHHIHVKPSKDM
ncbi:hypothetical protein [Dictyobacter alpinus]|nr:hypothetical protein [Dictyobacter alpinus]